MAIHVDAVITDPRTLLGQLLSTSLDGLFVVDLDVRVRMWNPAMERITGVPRRHALGEPFFQLLPQLREIGEDEAIVRALGGDSVITRDRQFTPRGREGRIECQYSPLRDSQGKTVGVLGVVRDVTELHRMIEEVRSLRRREISLRDRMARIEGQLQSFRDREESPEAPVVVDPRVFDIEAAVGYLSGDEDTLREMAEMFVVTSPEMLSALDAALDSGDWAEASLHLTRLKEAVVCLGGHRATWATGELEMQGRGERGGDMDDARRKVRVEVQRLVRALEAWNRGELRALA